MTASHRDRVAIVTGSGRGIGQQIAIALARREARIVLVDIGDVTETAKIIGQDVLQVRADVSSEEDWAHLAQVVNDRYGRADIVVNNAGIYPMAHIDQLDVALWRKTMAVNLEAHFLSAKHFVPLMRKHKWGRFVNVSSNSIGLPIPGMSHYMASKMGVIGFVRGLANDVAADGITVNAIMPTITNTPGTQGAPEEFLRSVWEQQPIRRFADPADIAGPVVFLTSDEAAFMTGQALSVDGGLYKVS